MPRFASPTLVALLAIAVTGPPALAQEGARRDEQQPEQKPKPKLTKPPQLLEATAPEYPPAALEARLTADVKVRIHIDDTGTVTAVDVVEPVGNGFDEAAVAAAMKYRFSPAEFDGVPGKIVVETVIHFEIQEQEVAEPPPPPPPEDTDAAADPEAQGPPSHGGDARLPVTISGQVVQRGTRSKLSGAIVSIVELGIDAVTDAEGRFYFHGVPPGDYHILAVSENHDRLQRGVTLAKTERSIEVRLWMRAVGGNPYETVVEAEREVLEVTKRTLQRRQMVTVPGTFGDPIRVIQALPGLARTPFISGLLIIRGSNPDDSAVFIDGHRVPLIFHFLGGPSILNAEFLESLDLYPGGYPARFGRAMGGVVSVETRPSKSDGIHGSADIDLLDSSAYVRMPIGDNGSFSLAARRSYLDFMLGFFLPEPQPGSTLIVVPVYYDYQARADWDFKEQGKASVFAIGSSDRLDVLSVDAETEQSLDLSSAIKFFRVIGTYKRPLLGNLRLTVSPAFGRDSVAFGSSQADAAGAFTSANIVQDTVSYRMRVDGKLRPDMVLDVGLDLESRVTRYDLLVPDPTDFVIVGGPPDIPPEVIKRNIDMLAYGVHADVGWDVTDELRLIPGLRLDSYLLQGEPRFEVDPRLVARYQFDDRLTFKGNVGEFHQPPQPEGFDDTFGNPDLKVEQSIHYGVGAELRPTDQWTVDGEVYYIDRYDIATFTTDVKRDEETGEIIPLNFINSGVSDTVGLEMLIKRDITRKLYGWLAYTMSFSRQKRNERSPLRPTLFDQRHTLNAVASYKTDGGWEVGARFRLATGRPYTPVIGATFDIDENEYDALGGQSRSARLPTFHQLDIRIEKTWVFNNYMLGGYLDIQNVYNADNVETFQYDYRFRDVSPIKGIPLLPTLGVRGQW